MDKEAINFIKKYKNITSRPFLTGFLDLYQQQLIQSLGDFEMFGGYKDASRKRASNKSDFEIICLKIVYPKKYYQIKHRDVLGSLFSLGIDISLVGDIVYSIDNDIYFFTSALQETFFKNNLTKIKNTKVNLLKVNPQEIIFVDNAISKTLFVKSLRLDLLIANVFNISRFKAKDVVIDERVRVNDKLITNATKVLGAKAEVSVRGYGKFKVNNFKLTKNNNLKIDILVYC